MSLKKFYFIIISTLFCLIPLFLWLQAVPISSKFSNLLTSLLSIGQVAGLVGASLFALTLFLNTRIKILEDFFGGLNKVYIYHHTLGKISFFLLVLHPVAVVASYTNFSLINSINFIVKSDPAVRYGTESLFILVLLLILTLWIKLPYRIWFFTHKFLGVSFFFASLHILFIKSDVSFNMPLRTFMYFVLALGLLSFSYKTLFEKLTIKKYKYKIEGVNQAGEGIYEVVMSPISEKLKFKPGQFVFVRFKNKIENEDHPFSITSGENEKNLKITIKDLGDFTSRIKLLEKGDLAFIEGPYGRFVESKSGKDEVWIAGGIGITPFLSMARSLGFTKDTKKIDLIYFFRDEKEAVFVSELKEISKKIKNFSVFLHESKKKGRLDLEKVLKISSGLDKEFYICGPIPMIRSFKKQLKEKGVPQDQIHSEEFQLL